ncbi:MAG TPA: hypothetical protein ENG66_01045 [Thermococcus sp.]|nr:hypothetical protein [Thermococcus sp.]
MGKGRPFLEIFTLALNEDYRFPILEIFAFLYALGTFAMASFGTPGVAAAEEASAYYLVNSLSGLPLFVFLILIFKNVAYGLGKDLEQGVIQTLFSYPLKRWQVLTAKLLSAIGVALLLFLGIQISALFILAPGIIKAYFTAVLLTYAAQLSVLFFLTGILLLFTLFLKRGGLAIVAGIILYFALSMIPTFVMFYAYATGSSLPLKILAVINPTIVLQRYYLGEAFFFFPEEIWVPSFFEVLLYLSSSYIVVAFIFLIAYIYFERRLGI